MNIFNKILFFFFLLIAFGSNSIKNDVSYNSSESKNASHKLIQDLRACSTSLEKKDVRDDLEHCFNSVLSEVEKTSDLELKKQLYLVYLESLLPKYAGKNIGLIIERFSKITEQQIDNHQNIRSFLALSNAHYCNFNFNESYKLAGKALNASSNEGNTDFMIQANIRIAQALIKKNEIYEAYQNILSARFLLQRFNELEAQELRLSLNAAEFLFHFTTDNSEEALRTLNESKIIHSKNLDTIKLMWLETEYVFLGIKHDIVQEIKYKVDGILDYADHHQLLRLRNHTLSLYRSYLVENQMYEELYELYHDRYPEELAKVKEKNYNQFCTFQAYFCENKGQMDSARLFYNDAEEHLKSNRNPYYRANFYRRYGEFEMRQKNSTQAVSFLEKAYSLSDSLAYSTYTLPISELLVEAYKDQNDYKNLAKYLEVKTNLLLQRLSQANSDQLLKMRLESQKKEREFEAANMAFEERRKHNIQFFGIALSIIVLLILLVIISSFQVPAWTIEMFGYFSILFMFEFIILFMDHYLLELTQGSPIKMFLIKVVIISFLYPLHHLIEHTVTKYLVSHNLIGKPSFKRAKRLLAHLWPWLKKNNDSLEPKS